MAAAAARDLRSAVLRSRACLCLFVVSPVPPQLASTRGEEASASWLPVVGSTQDEVLRSLTDYLQLKPGQVRATGCEEAARRRESSSYSGERLQEPLILSLDGLTSASSLTQLPVCSGVVRRQVMDAAGALDKDRPDTSFAALFAGPLSLGCVRVHRRRNAAWTFPVQQSLCASHCACRVRQARVAAARGSGRRGGESCAFAHGQVRNPPLSRPPSLPPPVLPRKSLPVLRAFSSAQLSSERALPPPAPRRLPWDREADAARRRARSALAAVERRLFHERLGAEDIRRSVVGAAEGLAAAPGAEARCPAAHPSTDFLRDVRAVAGRWRGGQTYITDVFPSRLVPLAGPHVAVERAPHPVRRPALPRRARRRRLVSPRAERPPRARLRRLRRALPRNPGAGVRGWVQRFRAHVSGLRPQREGGAAVLPGALDGVPS